MFLIFNWALTFRVALLRKKVLSLSLLFLKRQHQSFNENMIKLSYTCREYLHTYTLVCKKVCM